jgi:hypothetical protein
MRQAKYGCLFDLPLFEMGFGKRQSGNGIGVSFTKIPLTVITSLYLQVCLWIAWQLTFYYQIIITMKKIIAIMLVTGIALGSMAQGRGIHGGIGGRFSGGVRTVVVVPGYGYGYSPYGFYPGFGYGFGYGFGPQARTVTTKLDLEIEQIKSDYHHEISDVKHDKSIPKDERKQKVRDLKHERDNAIISAKQSYYNNMRERH